MRDKYFIAKLITTHTIPYYIANLFSALDENFFTSPRLSSSFARRA